MLVLGIESSCDETAVAVVNDRCERLADLVLSQTGLHAPYGGIVPEIAARAHLDHLDRMIAEALAAARIGFGDLAGVAATARRALEHAGRWIGAAAGEPLRLEAGARRFALTLGRTVELALLAEHAGYCRAHGLGERAACAARRFAAHGVDLIRDDDLSAESGCLA